MQPPHELVFRDCTPHDLITKLRNIGCDADFSESSPQRSGNVFTQHISLSIRELKPIGAWFAWRDGSSSTSLVYLPLTGPVTLSDVIRFVLSPLLGLIGVFTNRFDAAGTRPDGELRDAENEIRELLATDGQFAHDGYYSYRDGPHDGG